MPFAGIHYFPLPLPLLMLLFLIFAILVVLAEIGILRFAYGRLGINPRYFYLFLLLSLLGSYINIPVAQLPPEEIVTKHIVSHLGMRYVVPVVVDRPGPVIAVNVGGALVPTLLSLYILLKKRLYVPALFGVAAMTVVVHVLAHPVPGVGIAEPTFIPPLVAAGVGLLLSRRSAPALAYICGSLGTLIGADLLNLGAVEGLGAPVASIGGAGTFDGIFLTGVLGVLLAALFSRRHATPSPV
jgi:uncharacterized membrane protein